MTSWVDAKIRGETGVLAVSGYRLGEVVVELITTGEEADILRGIGNCWVVGLSIVGVLVWSVPPISLDVFMSGCLLCYDSHDSFILGRSRCTRLFGLSDFLNAYCS